MDDDDEPATVARDELSPKRWAPLMLGRLTVSRSVFGTGKAVARPSLLPWTFVYRVHLFS
jgi:hypothetical protein